jgi:Kef-type K+ transport system membrane component KefB
MFYAKGIGYSWRESSAIGALMNTRGLMILVFANIGLSSKLISTNDYCILFLIAVITTVMTTPVLKWSLGDHYISEECRDREKGVDG